VIQLAKTDQLKSKVILMSTRTHQNYYKVEEDWPGSWEEMGYGCAPHELMPLLGIGLVLCDEFHQEFHANFKAMLYMHVPHLIAMSATLVHLDPFLTKMYKRVFPLEHRYEGMEYDRYIKYYPTEYTLKTPERVRTTGWGDTRYSHTAYERSILKHHPTFSNYKQLLHWNPEIGYIKDYQPGDRAAVYRRYYPDVY
jgi:superfamily II DNA or RNA helicase